MKCDEIQNELILYYYKELDSEKSAVVDTHLKQCQTCRDMLKEIEETLRLVDQRRDIEPGEELWDSYLDNVYQKIDESSPLARFYKNVFIEPKLAPILATSLLVIILVASSSLYLVNKNKTYEQMQLAQNIDLFMDFDLIQNLDLLENLELLQETDISNEQKT